MQDGFEQGCGALKDETGSQLLHGLLEELHSSIIMFKSTQVDYVMFQAAKNGVSQA